ncbi:MAG: hypothetical protein J2P41_00030 [Blastocatellia bacterium]|nr:hypothetical protein [Blastocatellia bacterium]
MGIVRRMIRAGSYRLAMRAAKIVPLVGMAVGISMIGYDIRKKGIYRGLVNTALDATPIVGLIKNTIEMFTGDWLPDRKKTSKQEEERIRGLGEEGTRI